MIFLVSRRGRAEPAGRKKMAVARLGASSDAQRRRGWRGKLFVLRLVPRFRLRSMLLRSQMALRRLRDYYAGVMRALVADAASLESPRARKKVEAARPVVVPAAVAGVVLRCNSHYYIR